MKKLYITGVPDIGNQGSLAMLKAFIDNMNTMPEAYAYVLDTDNVKAAQETISDLGIENVEIIPDGFSLKSGWRAAIPLKYYFKLSKYKYNVLRRKFYHIILKKMSECDAIVHIGGDTLSHSSGQFNTIMQLDKLLIGKSLGLRTAILAQTLGIYKNPYLKPILRRMRKIDLITVREDRSLHYMHSLGLKRVLRTADLAFLLQPANHVAKQLQLTNLGQFACLVPSSMLYRKTFSDIPDIRKKYAAYLAIVKYIVKNLLERDLKVLLLPHVFVRAYRDDLDAAYIKKIMYSKDKRVIHFGQRFYAHEAKEIIRYSQCVVSFRMHPALAAVSQRVPAFLITDSHKGEGIIGELESERFIINSWGMSESELRGEIERYLPEFLDTLAAVKCKISEARISELQEKARENLILLDKLINGGNIGI